jgi:hypothetical protein
MNIALPVLVSLSLGALYGYTASFHGGPGMAVGLATATIFAAAFLIPSRLFRYATTDAAPLVLSQLGRRWLLASGLGLAAALLVAAATPWNSPLQLAEELYMYTVVVLLIFFGLAGLYADHIVYLQVTRQYNSNQLLAVTMLLVVLFIVLVLYFLSFDFAATREPYVYVRDLALVTLAFAGFGWHAFRIAHH